MIPTDADPAAPLDAQASGLTASDLPVDGPSPGAVYFNEHRSPVVRGPDGWVAVVGLPHPYWIEAVTAVVVRKPGAGSMTEDEVIAHCRAQMAHFKVPKKVIFVDALPKNPSGKLLKRELRTRYEATMKDLPAAGR